MITIRVIQAIILFILLLSMASAGMNNGENMGFVLVATISLVISFFIEEQFFHDGGEDDEL